MVVPGKRRSHTNGAGGARIVRQNNISSRKERFSNAFTSFSSAPLLANRRKAVLAAKEARELGVPAHELILSVNVNIREKRNRFREILKAAGYNLVEIDAAISRRT